MNSAPVEPPPVHSSPSAEEKLLSAHHRFSPEFHLLLACASCNVGERAENVGGIICGDFDWQKLLRIAENHRLIPQVYGSLYGFGNLVPAEIRETLRRRYQAHVRQTLLLTRDLVCVVKHLASRGIQVLPYKGPALAAMLHGNSTQRQFSDLDLLVHSSAVVSSKAALIELGYKRGTSLTAREERYYMQSGYECAFDLPDARNVLELKWRVLPRFYSIDFDIAGFFDRAVRVKVGEHSMRTLCPEDLLLVLCVHAAKHAWSELSLLWDVARLIQSQPINWSRVNQQVSELGIQRILAINLDLAQNLIGAPVPAFLQKRAQTQQAADLAVRKILPVLSESLQVDTESIPYFRLMLDLRERWRDQVRVLWRLLITPGAGEWSTVRLPEWLFPLYHVVRMYRLAGRLWKYLRLGPLAPTDIGAEVNICPAEQCSAK